MRIKIEPLGAVKARQVLWLLGDAAKTEGLSDTDLVRTYTEVTPFGNYLIGIERIEK